MAYPFYGLRSWLECDTPRIRHFPDFCQSTTFDYISHLYKQIRRPYPLMSWLSPVSNVKKVVQDRIYQCCIIFGQSIRQAFDREEISVSLNDTRRENLQGIDIERHCRRCFIDVDAPQRRDLSSIGFVMDWVSEPDSGRSESLDSAKDDPAGIIYKEKEAMNLPSSAQAYWRQRHALSECRDRVLALCDAVNWPTDLYPYQWATLIGYALEFAPDLILELGRGRGNSTCAFTQAANKLESGACRVVSLCQSDSWEKESLPRVRQVVPTEWFDPVDILQGDILTFDFQPVFETAQRILVFWDAHGYDVAECVLGEVLPRIADRPHVVIMHDLVDARYLPDSFNQYGEHGLWKGNDWSGPRLRIGAINSAVEQAVAITDFASRNNLSLHSADHSLHTELGNDADRLAELRHILGDQLFSLNARWWWFSLNEQPGPYTFPRFQPPPSVAEKRQAPLSVAGRRRGRMKRRLKVAIKVLLGHYPDDRFL